MFQARHMNEIAATIRALSVDLDEKTMYKVRVAFADMLLQHNPRFEPERFYKASEFSA